MACPSLKGTSLVAEIMGLHFPNLPSQKIKGKPDLKYYRSRKGLIVSFLQIKIGTVI